MDYYDAILKCTQRYDEMLYECKRIYHPTAYCKLESVYDFNKQLRDECEKKELAIEKLNRWLGYIQGYLIAHGITTVEIERDWTRPIFTPLDKAL